MKIQQSENQSTAKFVLTHSVRGNLKNLARAVVLRYRQNIDIVLPFSI